MPGFGASLGGGSGRRCARLGPPLDLRPLRSRGRLNDELVLHIDDAGHSPGCGGRNLAFLRRSNGAGEAHSTVLHRDLDCLWIEEPGAVEGVGDLVAELLSIHLWLGGAMRGLEGEGGHGGLQSFLVRTRPFGGRQQDGFHRERVP